MVIVTYKQHPLSSCLLSKQCVPAVYLIASYIFVDVFNAWLLKEQTHEYKQNIDSGDLFLPPLGTPHPPPSRTLLNIHPTLNPMQSFRSL